MNRVRGLPDDFSRNMLDGALKALGHADNPVRAHQFAVTLRELMDHVLEVMAPTADVARCPWFKQETDRDGPPRRQRALYTCRGGLTDDFLKSRLSPPAFVGKRSTCRYGSSLISISTVASR
jgi:hypothetical protein